MASCQSLSIGNPWHSAFTATARFRATDFPKRHVLYPAKEPLGPFRSIETCASPLHWLGIGLTSATFAMIDAVLLRKLPVPNPDQLVWINGLSERGARPVPLSVFERLAENFDAAGIFGWNGTIIDVSFRDRTEMAIIRDGFGGA